MGPGELVKPLDLANGQCYKAMHMQNKGGPILLQIDNMIVLQNYSLFHPPPQALVTKLFPH